MIRYRIGLGVVGGGKGGDNMYAKCHRSMGIFKGH